VNSNEGVGGGEREKLSIAVLMTCHNRRQHTLRSLQAIDSEREELSECNKYCISLEIFLVDDGSGDGTKDAVASAFPYVRIINGDGSLFWNGGMRLAWEVAGSEGFDGYLWLNDDTVLRRGAIESLVSVERQEVGRRQVSGCIVVGSAVDPRSGEISYGGIGFGGMLQKPGSEVQEILWSFNGNIVYVSNAVFEKVGNLCDKYRHRFGDVDYGIRARKMGIPLLLAPGVLGECERNPEPWCDSNLSLYGRILALHGPKGLPLSEFRHFMLMQGRWWWWWSYARALGRVVLGREGKKKGGGLS